MPTAGRYLRKAALNVLPQKLKSNRGGEWQEKGGNINSIRKNNQKRNKTKTRRKIKKHVE